MASIINSATTVVLVMASCFLVACSSTANKTRGLLLLQADAHLAYSEGNCDIAMPLYRRLADARANTLESLLRLGNCYARTQQLENAIAVYREAVQLDPTFAKAWYNLSYMQAQQFGQTVTEMLNYVDPADPAALRIRLMAEQTLTAFNASLDVSSAKHAEPVDGASSPVANTYTTNVPTSGVNGIVVNDEADQSDQHASGPAPVTVTSKPAVAPEAEVLEGAPSQVAPVSPVISVPAEQVP